MLTTPSVHRHFNKFLVLFITGGHTLQSCESRAMLCNPPLSYLDLVNSERTQIIWRRVGYEQLIVNNWEISTFVGKLGDRSNMNYEVKLKCGSFFKVHLFEKLKAVISTLVKDKEWLDFYPIKPLWCVFLIKSESRGRLCSVPVWRKTFIQ